MGIARQSIEDLKKRSKISDFILSTTSGKLRGTKGMALCPFHGEKTASMSFTDVENLFHCFGCKEGGDIFKYVQEINNLEFQDAIEFVAEKYGFKLSYTQTNENSDFKVYQNKMDLLNDYFIESMESENSKEAKVYLESRKLDNNDINKYSISFVDKDEDKFNKYCKTNEITRDDLKRLGFMSSNENMLFKNRIMFPILSFRNDVIAYGGRAIDDFGFWYAPCGRNADEQQKFEEVEARPQGLEKLFCEVWRIPFSASLDDFSGRPASKIFRENLETAYIEMKERPPATAKRVLEGMYYFVETDLATRDRFSRL